MQRMSIHFSLLQTLRQRKNQGYNAPAYTQSGVSFGVSSNLQPVGLLRRRQRAFVQKIVVVLCAGLMMFLVVSSIIAAQATQVIPVAAHYIAQGAHVTARDVRYVSVPQHTVFQHTLTEHISAKNPLVTTCEIQPGMPILRNSVSHIPSIPEGFTTITVHLASADHTIVPGKYIDLAFSKPTQDSEARDNEPVRNGAKDNKNAQENYEDNPSAIDERYVAIVRHVIVMRIAQNQQSQQNQQNQQNSTTIALPAGDALRMLQAQAANPTLAIVAMKGTD